MDGQNPGFNIRGVEGERSALRAELLAWKDNANAVVLGNVNAIVDGISAAIRHEIFSTHPGPSFTTEVLSEIAGKAVDML